MRKLAIIPARSGSKGLKDKNILDLCGKPLLAHSIEAARESGEFVEVIVSTDAERYARIAERYGARVLPRSAALATDTTPTFAVVQDVLARTGDLQPDYFMLLQPTSPLRQSRHICEAIAMFEAAYDRFDFLASVTAASHPAVLVRPLAEDGSLRYFDADYAHYCRQRYHDYTPNGAIYLAKVEAYLQQRHFYGPRSLAYVMEKRFSLDIDDRIDYELVKIVAERLRHAE